MVPSPTQCCAMDIGHTSVLQFQFAARTPWFPTMHSWPYSPKLLGHPNGPSEPGQNGPGALARPTAMSTSWYCSYSI